MRLGAMSAEVASAMRVSLNGMDTLAAENVRNGEWALLHDSAECYALVSVDGDTARIEAIEGNGGTELALEVIDAARAVGMRCDAWVFDAARVRLCKRVGFVATGESRTGANGTTQYRVLA